MYAELMGNHKNTEIKSFVDNRLESATIQQYNIWILYTARRAYDYKGNT